LDNFSKDNQLTKREKQKWYVKMQKEARKDIERAFEVLQVR